MLRGGIGRARAGRDAGERHHSIGGCTTDKPHHPGRVRQSHDPVSGGFVENLARPGGNITGFLSRYRP